MKKVKIRGEEYELEVKDALLIETIQDLTNAIRGIKW